MLGDMSTPTIDADGRVTGWLDLPATKEAPAGPVPVSLAVGDWAPVPLGTATVKRGVRDRRAWVAAQLDKQAAYYKAIRDLAARGGLAWAIGKGGIRITADAAVTAAVKESSMNATKRTIGSDEPGYTETRQAEPPKLRRLAERAIERAWARMPWTQYVTNVVPGADVIKYLEHGGSVGDLTESYVKIAGPSGIPSVVWVPTDGTVPTLPATITLSTGGAITARTSFVSVTLSHELDADGRSFRDVRSGQPHIDPVGTSGTTIGDLLAEGLAIGWNESFARGTGSATSPVTGIVWLTITSTSVTGVPNYADVLNAIYAQREAYREPNVVFGSVTFCKELRKERDNDAGLLFPPGAPLVVDGVPVEMLNGLNSDAHVVLGDFEKVVVVWRLQPNGLLAMASESYLSPENFRDDKVTYTVRGRWDVGLVTGYTTSITKLV